MKAVVIGLFAVDYMISLANALADLCDLTLFLSRRNLAAEFPGVEDLESDLRRRGLLSPRVSLRLIAYPRGQYWNKFRVPVTLIEEIRKLRPDVVHYQSGGEPWVVPALPFIRKRPLVVTIHDAHHHPGDKPPKFVLQAKNRILTRLADQIIVHGKEQAESLARQHRFSPKKLNVIFIGSGDFYTQSRVRSEPPEAHTTLFFGRVCAYKGVDVLVEAAPLIAARVPDLRIVVAGEGYAEALEQVKADPSGCFEIHNRFIPAAETPALFRRAALVVLPYLDATQSAIVPMAYTFGRPVVATRVGSIPEVVEDGITGILVEPGDARALADAVVGLLLDPELRTAMGKAARRKSQTDLSWKSIAAQTLAVYTGAVDRRGQVPAAWAV
jgi:glycosyltransferase involved in cell wall biosynthesis